MAYIYLLNLYDEVDDRIQKAQTELSSSEDHPMKVNTLKGRVDILKEFKSFLSENLNNKLPKRIRKTLSKSWICCELPLGCTGIFSSVMAA